MNFIVNILSLGIPFSVALLIASLGEMFNQRAGVFNLGCEGIMAMGAFLGMLVPYSIGQGGPTSGMYNVLGLGLAMVVGALLGIFFAFVVVTFRAPQGIAGIGLQMFGVGTAGTLFRHFIGGTQSVPGIGNFPIPGLSKIPFIGPIFFSHNVLVYLAFLFVPLAWYILFKTPWGLRVRAVGTNPRAADSIGIQVNKVRYQALAVGGALAGLAGAYLSLAQVKMFSDEIIAGRGFIAVALVYFGHWHPVKIMGGALLFSLAQALQLAIQGQGINFPYEFAVMLPYVLVIIVLAFSRESQLLGPTSLGIPFNREKRI
ncbi:ABC transporter permease [Sphaerochaeta halotolerans]|jgi:simple sugar transport system permease protein|uniref:ABC transporter permease n=1 Tax=Sphaerochaeta halotolerans TaxID=2293840 RepID=A0A372MG31_9SPIR|nr:ABC transporter permease [Sphaerochaeta halotolerans]MBG0766961.1 ABC transporter permease [Spirochaetaceae bacterium]MDN5334277.1 ral nucleoside transport system permease protein [Sphaerochaeta sp.]MXI86783.1 ABC transporter permease [Sphaerochaeta halotolerans]RFU94393.1 ABC transporter permease [Sphaerochaeta halotolerans]